MSAGRLFGPLDLTLVCLALDLTLLRLAGNDLGIALQWMEKGVEVRFLPSIPTLGTHVHIAFLVCHFRCVD